MPEHIPQSKKTTTARERIARLAAPFLDEKTGAETQQPDHAEYARVLDAPASPERQESPAPLTPPTAPPSSAPAARILSPSASAPSLLADGCATPAVLSPPPEQPRAHELFDAWCSDHGGVPDRQQRRARDAREREAELAKLEASRAALQSVTSSTLARFVDPDPDVLALPPLPRDRAAERQRRGVEVVMPGRVARADLCKTLNVGHDDRASAHIQRCRQHLEDEDARDLAPNRRARPVSKEDVTRTVIHREARIMVAAIANSRGSHVIQSYLRRLRPIFSGVPLAALRDAALWPQPLGGFRWTYADDCARRRIAIGLLWLVVGRWTSQRTAFGSRSSRRGLLVAGISVDRMLRAATPVGRKRYDRHVFGSRTCDGWKGDMWHFERAGFAVRKRLPPTRCNAWEVGPSGQAKNRYWVGCVVSQRTRPTAAQRRRASNLSTLGSVAGAVVFEAAAHDIGWMWAEESIAWQPAPAPS